MLMDHIAPYCSQQKRVIVLGAIGKVDLGRPFCFLLVLLGITILRNDESPYRRFEYSEALRESKVKLATVPDEEVLT